MIQLNLLPDVKLEFIKAERLKRLVISVSIIASVVALAVFVLLLFVVDVLQHKNLDDLNKDIKMSTAQIRATPDLNKVLTVQNQLATLSSLHDAKPVASRLFSMIGQVTPQTVTISNVSVDFTANTMTLTGNAQTIDNINTFVDTLKFTNFTTSGDTTSQKAFSDVVLTSFSRTSSGASYTINMNVDQAVFSGASDVTLSVPSTVTTRSVTNQPTGIFKKTDTSK